MMGWWARKKLRQERGIFDQLKANGVLWFKRRLTTGRFSTIMFLISLFVTAHVVHCPFEYSNSAVVILANLSGLASTVFCLLVATAARNCPQSRVTATNER